MDKETFYQNCLIHCPEAPEWYKPEPDPELNKIDLPDKTDWFELLGPPQKQTIGQIFANIVQGGMFNPADRPGKEMKDKGQLDWMKKPQLVGIEEKIDGWYQQIVRDIENNRKLLLKHNMRRFFLWKRYYAFAMTQVNFNMGSEKIGEYEANNFATVDFSVEESPFIPGKFIIPKALTIEAQSVPDVPGKGGKENV